MRRGKNFSPARRGGIKNSTCDELNTKNKFLILHDDI